MQEYFYPLYFLHKIMYFIHYPVRISLAAHSLEYIESRYFLP